MSSGSTGTAKWFSILPVIQAVEAGGFARPCSRRLLQQKDAVLSAYCNQVQRRFRLTSSTDFKRVRRNGKSYAHPLLVLIAQPNDRPGPRFAVSAGRSVGNAVQRNRAKRLIREAVRPLIAEIALGWDILLLARQPLAKVSSVQARDALLQLLRRANLLVKANEH